MIKTVALGADHGGYELKNAVKEHLQSRGIDVVDCGTNSAESVDYPDMAVPPCKLVLTEKADVALLFCGTGVGISIAANKIKGIRACCCSDVFSATYTRLHNDANALCMGGRVVGAGLACMIADAFIDNEFEGGRHALRVAKITALEKELF
ncbi:MAG: ribose 5-phosphate isomerase B [Ruthenibacterium sp.]